MIGTVMDMPAKFQGVWKNCSCFKTSEVFNPSAAETGIFRANVVSTMSPDDLAPCMDITSAAMILVSVIIDYAWSSYILWLLK